MRARAHQHHRAAHRTTRPNNATCDAAGTADPAVPAASAASTTSTASAASTTSAASATSPTSGTASGSTAPTAPTGSDTVRSKAEFALGQIPNRVTPDRDSTVRAFPEHAEPPSARAPQGPPPQPPPPTDSTEQPPSPPTRLPESTLPGLALAGFGTALAFALHLLVPAVPALTLALVLGVVAAHLPGVRGLVNGLARKGLTCAGKRLMRLGIVLLGLKLSLGDVLGLGWSTVGMVVAVVLVTFLGTRWLGRLLGLPRDQPLLIATGYAICGASAIGAVSEVRRSADPESERDVATSIALVTLCGTLAIAVLPLLQHPLGLDDVEFGRWVGAGVHDVGQVVATAQTAGGDALGQAVLVKLVRVLMLAPLVAAVAFGVRARLRKPDPAGRSVGEGAQPKRRPALVPLFVVGFAAAAAVRTTGVLPTGALDAAATVQEVLLAAALFGLGSAVHLPTLARTGPRVAALGVCAWTVIAGVSYVGVFLTG